MVRREVGRMQEEGLVGALSELISYKGQRLVGDPALGGELLGHPVHPGDALGIMQPAIIALAGFTPPACGTLDAVARELVLEERGIV